MMNPNLKILIAALGWFILLGKLGPLFSTWDMTGAAAFGYVCAIWFSANEKGKSPL